MFEFMGSCFVYLSGVWTYVAACLSSWAVLFVYLCWVLTYVAACLFLSLCTVVFVYLCGGLTYTAACLFEFVDSCFCLFVWGFDVCSHLFVRVCR